MSSDKIRIFMNLKDKISELPLVFAKQNNLRETFYYIFLKLLFTGSLKIKILYKIYNFFCDPFKIIYDLKSGHDS